ILEEVVARLHLVVDAAQVHAHVRCGACHRRRTRSVCRGRSRRGCGRGAGRRSRGLIRLRRTRRAGTGEGGGEHPVATWHGGGSRHGKGNDAPVRNALQGRRSWGRIHWRVLEGTMTAPARTLVWDLPTRLFHWALAILILLQYGTAEWHWLSMRWHVWLGYATLALLLFRVFWGFAGSQTARFADFVRGPRRVFVYMRELLAARATFDAGHNPGHNPMGGWSVLAM